MVFGSGMIKGFFRKQRKIKVAIIDEASRVIFKKSKYENNVFTIRGLGEEDQAYIVDHNFTLTDLKSGLPISFYYINNPSPIRIQHERNREVDSIGFKKILDSKAIQDLFSSEGDKKMMLLIILIAANILISLVLLLIQFKVIKIGVTT